jgi:hypothetical protein
MARRPDVDRTIWALRHEITHWRHRDPLAGLTLEIARIVFFFHPLVWWVGKQWKVATEIACDQALVGSSKDARQYAEQLYQILKRVHTRRRIMLANGLFATRTQIGKRIEILLKTGPRKTDHKLPSAVFMTLFAVLVLSLGAEITPLATPGASGRKIIVKDTKGSDASVLATIHEDDDDGHDITLSIKGDIEFNDDKTDILSIAPGGEFELTDLGDGVERELKVTPSDDGTLEWVFKVDGEKKPFDEEARKWFSGVMEDVHFDDEFEFVFINKPGIVIKQPGLKSNKKRVTIQVEDPSGHIDIFEDDGSRSVVEMQIHDDDDSSIFITTKGKIVRRSGDNAIFTITPGGAVNVVIKKDGDKHELEIPPGGNESDYIYKLNGEKRPYDDNAKKVFEKYIRQLEDGVELHPGEKI